MHNVVLGLYLGVEDIHGGALAHLGLGASQCLQNDRLASSCLPDHHDSVPGHQHLPDRSMAMLSMSTLLHVETAVYSKVSSGGCLVSTQDNAVVQLHFHTCQDDSPQRHTICVNLSIAI